jgi:hypothetical protein
LSERPEHGAAPEPQGAPSLTPAVRSAAASGRLPGVVLFFAIVAAYLILGAIGNAEARRNVRVMPLLDPLIDAVTKSIWPILGWLTANWIAVLAVFTAALASLVAVALLRAGRVAAPLVALGAAFVLGAWGQSLLLRDQIVPGAILYVAGLVAAIALGVWRPLRSLRGFDPPATSSLPFNWECTILFLLVLFGMALRMWAITELAAGYDHETIGAMMRSRRLHGVRTYLDESLLSTAPGFVHVPTQFASFLLFGTSIYSIRMAAMVWGVAAIPLLYWLVRRMAGVGPAMLATFLFVIAPEQIFWARTENTFFAPVGVCALITAHLGLNLVERPSFRTALAAALWMPFCRYFYIPTLVLFTYPLLVYGHAMVFLREARRKALVVLPTLAAGVGLWIFSLSILFTYLHGRGWKFVHPAIVYGAPAWRKLGQSEFTQASTLDLIVLQAKLIGGNLAEVVSGLTYTDPLLFSHWFARYQVSQAHQTLMVPALGVLFVLGLGYMLGQLRDRRAAALLIWIGISLLPAVMSNEPSGRRLAVIFPAIYTVVALSLAAFYRLVRGISAQLRYGFAVLFAPVMAGIVWFALASFYLNQTMPMPLGQQARFVQPLIESSDILLSDLEDERWRMFFAFANMDEFLEHRPCYQYVKPDQWIPGLVQFSCNFGNLAYELSLTEAERAETRRRYDPREVSLLVTHQWGAKYDPVPMLRAAFPAAKIREYGSEQDPVKFTSLTFTMDELEALRSPQLIGAADDDLQTKLIAGIRLRPAAGISGPDDGRVVVRGGIYLPTPATLRFELEPPCPGAELTVAGTDGATARPLDTGIYPFELRLPGRDACPLPLKIVKNSGEMGNLVPIETTQYTAPSAVGLDSVGQSS